MSRPGVSVVMPFAGTDDAARAAAGALRSVDVTEEDELVLVDNTGGAPDLSRGLPAIRLVRALAERSPAHARNAGAAASTRDWILFLDADCQPESGLLRALFASQVPTEVGAIAGAIVAAAPGRGLVSRYGSARSFLDQQAHMTHPYRPRAAAANLLVRRRAFDQLGGFFEGLRAAEDTDFAWRLQEAGWRLELRPDARVRHVYRSSLPELRRQWRGYAAGRAWLARRYPDFHPQPALARALRKGRRRSAGQDRHLPAAPDRHLPSPPGPSGFGRILFLAVDLLLALDELVGLVSSNRPAGRPSSGPARIVLLADAFPNQADPLVELAGALGGARVLALRRPDRIDVAAGGRIEVDYLEDDGGLARALAWSGLWLRHPMRCALDRLRGGRRSPYRVQGRTRPGLRALASAVRRLEHEPQARLLALGPRGPETAAGRIARLAGRKLEELEGAQRSPGARRRIRG